MVRGSVVARLLCVRGDYFNFKSCLNLYDIPFPVAICWSLRTFHLVVIPYVTDIDPNFGKSSGVIRQADDTSK